MIEIVARATIEHILTTGRKMCVFRADDDHGRRRYVVQDLPRAPATGETWHIRGTLQTHPLHGEQVVVDHMTLERPEGQLLARLLAGSRFPGVGEATANKLQDAYGDQLVGILDAGDADALLRVLGSDKRSRDQVETILLEWPLVGAEPQLLANFDRIGIAQHVAVRLLLIYGTDAFNRLVEDPYRLLAFCDWKTADGIANRLGVADHDSRRLAAACEAVMHAQLGRGHTLLPHETLKKAASDLLGFNLNDEALDSAERVGAIRRRPSGWQASGAALMEDAIAQRIAAGLAAPGAQKANTVVFQHPAGLILNPGQSAAIAMALVEPFSLLVGGAGTGKTTVLRAICAAADAAGFPIQMMALSGRAALRMHEATGRRARTIAGWLAAVDAGQIDLSSNTLIVIDEASMVDLGSLYRIMLVAPARSRFLLIGDDGQLPPVGFGLTFHDLLRVAAIPRTTLTEVMRQSAETGIPAVAAAVREGVLSELAAYAATDEVGVSILVCESQDVVANAASVRRATPGAQIVGSIKGAGQSTDGGTIAMNASLREAWANAHQLDPSTWLRGEPVIWTVNDYDLDLWNGSLGKVLGMTDDGLAVRFDEGDRTVPIDQLEHLEPAWAITTHKAQGSQFGTVIVPVTKSGILDRTLIYTALTRGTRRVVFVGDPDLLRAALAREPHAARRSTWLKEATELAIENKAMETAHDPAKGSLVTPQAF